MVFSVAQTVPEELEGGPPDSQTESGHKISIFIKPNILSDNDYHNIKKNGLESKAKTAFFNPSSKRCFNLNRKNKKQIFNLRVTFQSETEKNIFKFNLKTDFQSDSEKNIF